MVEQPVSGCWNVWVTEVTKMSNDPGETIPFSILANLCTLYLSVVIIRYMSQGNPSQISVKVCAEIRGSSVLSQQNCLSGISGIVFQAPADSSCGSPPNDLWETAGYRVREIVFGSQQNRPLES